MLHEWQSDYSVFANNPIVFADPSGLDIDPKSYGTPPENPQNGDLWQNDYGINFKFDGTAWIIQCKGIVEVVGDKTNFWGSLYDGFYDR